MTCKMTCKNEELSAARRRPYLAVRNGRTRRCVGIASLLLLTAVVPAAEGQGSAPASPTNLYVPFVTRFEIAVAWTPPAGASMYKLEYRKTGSNGVFQSYGPDAIFDEAYMRLGDLEENTAYDLRVYAGNAAGWSAAAQLLGNPAVKTTNPPGAPLNVREFRFTETSVSLTWDDAEGAVPTHWRIKVSECEKKIWQVPCVDGRPCLNDRTVRCGDYQYYKVNGVTIEFNMKPAVILNLLRGNTYFMVVEARNLNMNGYDYGGSLPARVTPRGAYDSAPTNLRVNGVYSNAVLLSWEAAPGATHYRVQYRVPAEFAYWLPLASDEQLITTATLFHTGEKLSLTQDKTYEFRVLARDLFEQQISGGQVQWAGDVSGTPERDQFASNIVSAMPVMYLQTSPSGLSVVGVRETEVHLQWNALTRATYYVLQYKKVDEAYEPLDFWKDVEANPGEALRFTGTQGAVTQLTTGRRYQFRLKAFNTHLATESYLGYSGPSAVVYAVPLARLEPSKDFALVSQPWLDMLQCASNPCALQSSQSISGKLSADAPDTDGILVGAILLITSGRAMHANARITAYNGTSKVATLAVPFANLPAVGDTYEVSRYAVSDDRAIVTWTHFPDATKYKISIRRSDAHEAYATRAELNEPLVQTAGCTRVVPKKNETDARNGSSHPSLGLAATRCYELTGLQEGVSYDVILSAGNMHLDWGLDSAPIQITPVLSPSEAAARPLVLSQTGETVTFVWSTPLKSTAPTMIYRVMSREVTLDKTMPWSAPKDFTLLTDKTPGFEITGLKRGYAYDFQILSGNLAGFRYPQMSFRLVTPCTNVSVDAVRRINDCARRDDCNYMSVKISWMAPPFGYYFKVLARKRGSNDAYVGLPTVASPPYVSKATVLGPNITTFAFDNNHFPDLTENMEFEYKVVSSNSAEGPFENVGSVVVVAVSRSTPAIVNTLRLKSKTSRSITVNWRHTEPFPQPYFYVALLCPRSAANCSGRSLYPNHQNKSQATRFFSTEATLDRYAGEFLTTDLAYNITIYACNYFDADGDGVLTGDEGCNSTGTQLPYEVMPGGVADQVKTITVTQTYSTILRLEWQRPGKLGNAAIMYNIQQREMGMTEWTVATRILARGKFGTCVSDKSRCPECPPALWQTDNMREMCLQAVGVTYGKSQGEDTCGQDYCVDNFDGASMLITEGERKDEIRLLRSTPSSAPGNVFMLNGTSTLFGNAAIDASLNTFTSATYNVYNRTQLGGLCCPITSETVVAYVANLKPNTAYQFQVFAGNMNENQFETIGSQIATGFTISKPNSVEDLTFLYLVGSNASRVQWTDPGGSAFCGERMYQILARISSEDPWELLNLSAPHSPWIKHTEYNDGVGRVELTVMGLPWAGPNGTSYPPAVLENQFMVRSYCSNYLGLNDSAIPNITYLDDIAFSSVDGNVATITLKPAPSARVEGLQIVHVTENSAFLRWQTLPRAEIYKVMLQYDSKWNAGPWIRQFEAFSDWKNWPNENKTQMFRTTEAEVTGLTTGLRYRFKVMAGTRHGNIFGTFSAESLPTQIAYTLVRPPHTSDIELILFKITAKTIKVQFSVGSQMSIDPTNHTRPLISLLYKVEDGRVDLPGLPAFSGGLNASGCTNVVVADDTYIGNPPGCSSFTVLNYTADGRTFYEYNFSNIYSAIVPVGTPYRVMVKTFNLHSPTGVRVVYSGNATSCICASYGSKRVNNRISKSWDNCIEYRIFGSTLACERSASYAYMQPPASGNNNAYNKLYVFVRSGTGEGQRRRIVAWQGSTRRMLVDSPLEIILDETSVVEIHQSGLEAEGTIVSSCPSGDVVCRRVFLHPDNASAVNDAYTNDFIELIGGPCDKQVRRITGYLGAVLSYESRREIVVYPPFTCNPPAGTMFQIRLYSFATKSIGPIFPRGPPTQPTRLRTGLILHNSVELSWDRVTSCFDSSCTGSCFQLQCDVEVYRLRRKKTHDSSDFPVPNATWYSEYFYSPSTSTVFVGFEDMCSFEIQVSAKTANNDGWGPWSVSQYVKLTGGAPSLQPYLLPFEASVYNDRVLVKWTTDLNPKQVDRFYFKFGPSENNMRDFTTVIGNTLVRKVFMDYDVCTPQISAVRATCRAFLTGLEMGTIYSIKVFGGNMNGFEEVGTKIASTTTLLLPVSHVSNLKMVGIKLSGNVSGYGVTLSWSRPQGYPPVNRYYVAASENMQAFRRLDPTIYSTYREVVHNVENLNKGTSYRFRIHCGNNDGPTGFHLDMDTDPSASDIVTVVPDGVPGRVQVTGGMPIVPDMNSMIRLNWNVPNAGADASYYTIGTKLIVDLSGCDTCDKTVNPNKGFCLANNANNPIFSEATNTWQYRRCSWKPPCDATCNEKKGIEIYTGCKKTDLNCATNPSCDPMKGLCLTPCQGAVNEGSGSAGKPCIFGTTTGVVTGLQRDAWYEFYVSAGNTAGSGLESDPFWMKTAALPVPVMGLNISQVTQNKVRLEWNPMSKSLCTGGYNGNCTYKVTWQPPTAQGSEAYTARSTGSNGVYYESLFDHAVDFSQGSIRYVYRVYAGDDLTNLYEQFGTGITLPGSATDFRVVAATESSLTFNWIPDPAADTYQVYMSSGLLAYRSASAETVATTIRVEGLAKGLPYNFKVFSKVRNRTPFEYGGSNVYRAVPAGLSFAPRDLTVVATSLSTVTLTWKAGDDALPVRYKIVRSADGSADMAFPQDVEILKGGSHTALITDLVDNSEYTFKIFAGNFNGYEKVGSNEVRKVQPVGRARELSVRGVSDTSATINWLPPEYGRVPMSYQLQYTIGDVTTRIADVQHLGGSRNIQSALLTPLIKNEYKLRVFCRSRSGYYEPLGTGDLSVVPLQVPFGLRVILTRVDSVTLVWNMPQNISNGFKPIRLKIDYVMTSDGTTGKVDNIPVDQNTTTIMGLKTNRPYSFSIKAQFQSGLYFGTLSSNLVTATPFDQPSNLTIVAVRATDVSLEWVAPAVGVLPMAYRVRCIDIQTSVLMDVNAMPHVGSFKSKQAYTVTGLTNGRQYGFIVLAQAGTGAYSANEITPIKTTPLSVPSDLKIVSVTSTSAYARWSVSVRQLLQRTPSRPAGAVDSLRYELHYAGKVQIVPFGIADWLVTDLAEGVEYNFCLYIRSPAGDLIPGNDGRGACAAAVPVNQVTNLRTIDSTNSSITLEWDPFKPLSSTFSYVVIASPIIRERSAVTGEMSWVPVPDKPTLSIAVAHAGNFAHNATFENLLHSDIFSIQVFILVQGKYREPVGSNSLQVSAVGRATRTRLCYYDKTEVSIQWAAPVTDPITSRYRISFRPGGCATASWQSCSTSVTTTSIIHRGDAKATQSYSLMGLSEGTVYDVRVHAYNDETELFDPVGSVPLIVQPQGDRADFALNLPLGAQGFVEVSKASDHAARMHFETKSVTLEAWIKPDGSAGGLPGYQGVAGNLYSYKSQSTESRGAGHFGYGIYCETKFEGGFYCGIHIGTRTDFTTSLQGLCLSLSFEGAVFCGGDPGWTTWNRLESRKPIEFGVWSHIAGSYNHTTGLYILTVNGEVQQNKTISYRNLDNTRSSPEIYYSGNDGAYPKVSTFPRHRMDWNIGRLLIGESAPTVATAPHAYFDGTIDEVRVWSYGKTALQMRSTGYLDTVSPSSYGLLGYWPFDDPSYGHKCADEMRTTRDAIAGLGHMATLQGAARLVKSSVALDRAPVFSMDTPANNSELVVYLGDSIHLRAEAEDPNPSDKTYLVLQVPGSQYSHPSGATFSEVSESGAAFSWSPLPRDAGKNVTLCFELSNVVTNPLRPDFFLKQLGKSKRCIKIRVPLCVYKAQQGDTVRSIARKFKTNWRTIFMLNPEIGHPNDVAAGLTMRIGSLYTLRSQDNISSIAGNVRVSWESLSNNNAAIVNRLWSDSYFKAAGTSSGMTSVIEVIDPGESVFDLFYDDVEMRHNYTGTQLCLVAQLHSNCI